MLDLETGVITRRAGGPDVHALDQGACAVGEDVIAIVRRGEGIREEKEEKEKLKKVENERAKRERKEKKKREKVRSGVFSLSASLVASLTPNPPPKQKQQQ